MKKIIIPVVIVVAVLLILATVLSKTNQSSNEGVGYHTHADGVTHYDNQPEPTYHTHADGVTHYEEH